MSNFRHILYILLGAPYKRFIIFSILWAFVGVLLIKKHNKCKNFRHESTRLLIKAHKMFKEKQYEKGNELVKEYRDNEILAVDSNCYRGGF